jgi:hypothetical protein
MQIHGFQRYCRMILFTFELESVHFHYSQGGSPNLINYSDYPPFNKVENHMPYLTVPISTVSTD